eukprot:TRINITY_DN24961_c0_g1_i1.p1 TRINITY_DN24961_c0_g1~~TRINITY_DN24961_c0_g1_i1.p1  ORF type:complete len:588 (-),score=109.07 TRINITY_DN24961_c0_g1_i1:645-2408(-)
MASIVVGVQEYIQEMVERVSGMKVLIVDVETVGIISMVYSQSELLQHEIFRVDRVDVDQTEKMRHMKAICFLRPTDQNFILLTQMLKDPCYFEYHLFFSNVVPHTRLEQLACCDDYEVVKQVQEFFADVFAVNRELFSLNLPSTVSLCDDQRHWTLYEESIFDRTVEGLLSACLSLRILPVLRFSTSSELSRRIAQRVQDRITEELSLFESMSEQGSRGRRSGLGSPVLLVLDRRSDPVTPLLNQWTYQAMVHELLTLENNRVNMSATQVDVSQRPELRDVVLSTTQDEFFGQHCMANFPDLLESIKKYVDEFQKLTNNTGKVDSIEDMHNFVEKYPEFRKMSGNVSKHVEVVNELKRIIETNGLFGAGQLEQELACTENQKEHFRELMEELRSSNVTNMERLRLVMLYSLRYESNRASISQLKDALRANGISDEQVSLVDQMLFYGGSRVRSGDLFQKSMFAQVKSVLANTLKGDLFQNRSVLSVLTQHKSLLSSVADALMKGRLDEATYPFMSGCSYATPSAQPPPTAIVFVVGGTTFEEARDVAALNATLLDAGRSVILGGTTVHNSVSFLTDVAQVGARSQRG